MPYDPASELFANLALAAAAAGISPKHVAEIGVHSYELSAIREFADAGVASDLYEAVPRFCDEIERSIKTLPNAKLRRFAVSDANGEIDFYIAGEGGAGMSTFAANLTSSPALLNDNFQPKDELRITVPCRDFAEVDPGDYDVVTIDVEGGEWPIVRRMKSRPSILAVETHYNKYKNPHLAEIAQWCRDNGYVIWYLTRSDSVFFKGTPPPMSFTRRLRRALRVRKVYGKLSVGL